MIYSPVWNPRTGRISRFRLAYEDERQPYVAPGTSAADDFLRRDVGMVEKALEDLTALMPDAGRVSVVCTVRSASLVRAGAEKQLLAPLKAAPKLVQRALKFEVLADTFAGTPEISRFTERVADLGLACGLCVPLSGSDIGPAPPDSGDAAAVDVRVCEDEAEALARLTPFARNCARSGRHSVAYGLATRPLVLGALAGGLRFLSGGAIHADVGDLRPDLRFRPADLYPSQR